MREVTLTAVEPLFLGAGAGVSFSGPGLDYLPGAVLRGALANRWIAQHGEPQKAPPADREEFLDLFEGAVRYGPGVVEGSVLEPMAVQRCKYPPSSPECAPVDRAHPDPEERNAGQGCNRDLDACPTCHGPLEDGKGRVLRTAHVRGERASTALDENEVAAERELFSRQCLEPGTVLTGHIDGDHAWLGESLPDHVWLGGRRSVGGKARITCRMTVPAPPRRRDDGYIHVELAAPGVFVDGCGRPSLQFPYERIAGLLGVDQVLALQSWTRITRVSGWHLASRLPKPTDLALAAGSAVLVRPSQTVSDEGLARLASAGLGLRQAEGYGWIDVNPPPWRPPAAAPGTTPSPSQAVGCAAAIRDAGLAPWLLPRLKEYAIGQEQDAGAANPTTLLQHPRIKTQPQAIRDDVSRLIRDLDTLHEGIALLEAGR